MRLFRPIFPPQNVKPTAHRLEAETQRRVQVHRAIRRQSLEVEICKTFEKCVSIVVHICHSHSRALHRLVQDNTPYPRAPSLMIPEILLLVKQIRPRTPQVDDLRTPVPVLLEARALEAVERVRYPLAAADHALVLIVAEGALVADPHEGGGAYVRVAYGALAVTFVAEPADGYAWLLATHY